MSGSRVPFPLNAGNSVDLSDESLNNLPELPDLGPDFGLSFNYDSFDNNDNVGWSGNDNQNWAGVGPQDFNNQAWPQNVQQVFMNPQPFENGSRFINGRSSSGARYHDNSHQPTVSSSIGLPPQDVPGYSSGYAAGHAPIQTPSYGYGPQTVPNVASPSNHLPRNYNHQLDINEGSQYLPRQSGYAPLPTCNHAPMVPGRGVNAGASSMNLGQLHSDEDAEGEDDSFDAYQGGEIHEGDEEEDEDEEEDGEEEEEGEDSNIDNGEFVVSDVTGMVNIEKPGVVREDNGNLEWWNPKTNTWHRAVIHHNIRAELIAQAQVKHPGRQYRHPDPAGSGPNDITAFHVDYQDWGPDRRDRPTILYQFDPPSQKLPQARPGPMKFRGRIVLNHQNNPVLDWNIPATLSSKTSGSNMEAWKRFLGVGQEDMRARMVRYTNESIDGETQRVPLPDKNATINMPMQRFRDRAGCIAWSKRPGSDVLRTAVVDLMRSERFDPIAANSTEGFGRDLTADEQLQVKKGNKANLSSKARSQRPEEKGKRKRNPTEIREMDGSNDASPHDLINLPGTDLSSSQPATLPTPLSPQRKRSRHGGEMYAGGDHQYIGNHSPRPSVNLAQQLRANKRKQSSENRPRRSQRRATQVLRVTQLQGSNDEDDGADDLSASEFGGESEMSEDDIDTESRGVDGRIPKTSASTSHYQHVGLDGVEEDFPRPSLSSNNSRRLHRSDNHDPCPLAAFGGHIPGEEDLLNHRRKLSEFLNEPEDTGDNFNHEQENFLIHEREGDFIGDSEPPPKRRNVNGKGKAPENQAPQPPIAQRKSAPTQATASNIDCRKLTPITEVEREALESALEATREAFFEYTGYQSPEANRNTSYNEQWDVIHEAFEEFDWTGHPRCINGEPPFFPRLRAWYSSIEDYPDHAKDSMFYEAWVYGHRAPRNADGTLIVMNGDFLESIGKLEDGLRKNLLDRALNLKGFQPEHSEDEEEEDREEEEL